MKIFGRQLKDYDIPYILATAAPTPTDDGYSVPQMWIDTAADRAYMLIDSAPGNATWLPVGNASNLGEFQDSVKSIADCTSAPATEVTGDRYILNTTVGSVHANWDGASKNDIVEFDGVSWDAYTPSEGFTCWVDDENVIYVFDGSTWKSRRVYKKFDVIPMADGVRVLDGGTAPDAAETISNESGEIRVRKFSGTASQDVRIPWEVPDDIIVDEGIKYRAVGVITETTAPNNEGVSFKLSGYSAGDDNGIGAGPIGLEYESKKTGMSHARYDRFKTDLSSVVTLPNLASGELAMLKFYRDHDDTDDTYGQKIGVSAVVIQFSTKMSDSWKY